MIFWAKTTPDGRPGTSVFQHMINVGCVARCLAEIVPCLLERFRLCSAQIGALAALHDLGKISPGFQRKCEQWLVDNGLTDKARNACWDTTTEADHGKVSHAAIQDFLVQLGLSRSAVKYVAAALGAHHGRLRFLPDSRGIKPPLIKPIAEADSGIAWCRERNEAASNVWRFFQVSDLPDSFSDESPSIWWLAGLTTVADWIGSDERYFTSSQETTAQEAPLLARQALQAIGFGRPRVQDGLTFHRIFGFPPNAMQTRTLETITDPGVYVIEAPMGMGKTEAALGAAYQLLTSGKATGLYFVFPADAGMNRWACNAWALLRGVPRRRGDEPQ